MQYQHIYREQWVFSHSKRTLRDVRCPIIVYYDEPDESTPRFGIYQLGAANTKNNTDITRNPLFRVTGNCSVDIPCPRCQKTIICDVDGIYVSVFESEENNNEPKFGIQVPYPNNVTAFCR